MPNPANDGCGNTQGRAGFNTESEILSQPQCWSACLRELQQTGKLEEIRSRFAGTSSWLFVGCGSSYYVALSAAASMTALAGLSARAVPASDILLYPEITLAQTKNSVAVLISRSGRTSEVLRAAQVLKARGIPTLAISCAPGQQLEQMAGAAIVLPPADEKSMVMTRSFSSMLMSLQALAAVLAGNHTALDALLNLPGAVEPVLKSLPQRICDFVARHRFADYVYLGQGPFYGLACEGALKVTEMSVSYAQAFHTLEFRHGPKSIASPQTLLVFLLSESGYDAECEVLQEMKSLGGATLAIANKLDSRAHGAADLAVEFSLDVPEVARLAAYLFPTQLLGLYTGLAKGADPDQPRNLSRVVLLDEEKPAKPEHAAL